MSEDIKPFCFQCGNTRVDLEGCCSSCGVDMNMFDESEGKRLILEFKSQLREKEAEIKEYKEALGHSRFSNHGFYGSCSGCELINKLISRNSLKPEGKNK